MIGPIETFLRITFAAEEIGLPGRVGGDTRHFVGLGLIRDRVGDVGRIGGEDQIDLFAQDQFGRDFGGAARTRLAVLWDDLDRIDLAVVGDAGADHLGDLLENEVVGFPKRRDRPGRRADHPDLDRGALRVGGDHPEDRRRGDESAGDFDDVASRYGACVLAVFSY